MLGPHGRSRYSASRRVTTSHRERATAMNPRRPVHRRDPRHSAYVGPCGGNLTCRAGGTTSTGPTPRRHPSPSSRSFRRTAHSRGSGGPSSRAPRPSSSTCARFVRGPVIERVTHVVTGLSDDRTSAGRGIRGGRSVLRRCRRRSSLSGNRSASRRWAASPRCAVRSREGRRAGRIIERAIIERAPTDT